MIAERAVEVDRLAPELVESPLQDGLELRGGNALHGGIIAE
jgi:hypothetical protein